MLKAYAGADVDEGQVVVEDVPAQRNRHHEPGCEGGCDEQEPGDRRVAEVAVGVCVEPAERRV
jgi:hypothetical protein